MWFCCLYHTFAQSCRWFGSRGNTHVHCCATRADQSVTTRACVQIHTLPCDVYHSKLGSFEKWKKGAYTNIGNIFFERRNEISVTVGDEGGRKEKKGERRRQWLHNSFLFLFLIFFSQGLKTHRKHWELPLCWLPPIYFFFPSMVDLLIYMCF